MKKAHEEKEERAEKGSSCCLLIDFIGLVSSSSIRNHLQHTHTHTHRLCEHSCRLESSDDGNARGEERTVEDGCEGASTALGTEHLGRTMAQAKEAVRTSEPVSSAFVASTNNDTLMSVIRNSC